MTTAHQGHRAASGIQEHSCGPLFPFMIRGKGDNYQAFHCSGWEGILYPYEGGNMESHGPAHDLAEAQCRKYQGTDNKGRAKIDFLVDLRRLDDEGFVDYAESIIWLAAYANNNIKSDYHWRADACYDEAAFRRKPELYNRAFNRAKNSVA